MDWYFDPQWNVDLETKKILMQEHRAVKARENPGYMTPY
jgi:hypothetical protein